MQSRLIRLPKNIKQVIVIAVDVAMSLLATWLAFSLRLDTWYWPRGYQWHVYQIAPLLAFPIFVRLGFYRAIFRFTGMSAMFAIAKGIGTYGLCFFCLLLWLNFPGVPRSVGVLQPLLLLILVGGSRVGARFWLNHILPERHEDASRIVIYGAGEAGAQVAAALQQKKPGAVIGFLDDDPQLEGKTVNGRRVYAPNDLENLISSYGITDVLLALPAIGRARRNQILANLRRYQVHVRSLPDLTDIVRGRVAVSDIKELDIADLLGRDPVPPNWALISRNITDKTVMVTGAGGSIGSELCRQILDARPSCLLLIDHNEFSLYSIHEELLRQAKLHGVPVILVPLLGNVRDYPRIKEICKTWRPRTLYHAAAYKHVPMVEHNPAEGIRNNVLGTYNLARVAVEEGVSDFVLISTDKAVRPTNIMGASKRLAELILQALSACPNPIFGIGKDPDGIEQSNKTRFSMVRFGNVLGSSGSVVPLFRQQIRDGGPVTVTDPEVTRYFMTIPEAAQLVVQAAAMAEGGEVFVLDMGESVKIMDLARRVIELSGMAVKEAGHDSHGDIEIEITGLRPGEKLYEELLIGESPQRTIHPRIMKAHEDYLPWSELEPALHRLFEAVAANEVAHIREILGRLVSGYVSSTDIVDWVYLAATQEVG
ncbi:nucleoside-diphosphate sugar epimerase/dehydratase [Herbaspirillum lusitanum]|uniref:Nucleoside-diphosphate sugar epimerase/dehydratase n=1 Tax=Herbaspirillum lusitanum TaxID=213312 RepID=A0ABW9A827_9BURK